MPQNKMLLARVFGASSSTPDLQDELIKQGSRIPPGMGVPLPPSTPPGALGVTLERSKQLCLQMYEKELLTDSSYQAMTAQLVCTPEQLAAFAGNISLYDILDPFLEQ